MAQVLSGKEVSQEIRNEIGARVKEVQVQHPNFKPGLAIVQVGDREDSNVYIGQKIKAAAEVGIAAQHVKLPRSTTQHELVSLINKLNDDHTVDGMIVQLPLQSDKEIDTETVLNTITARKDVDGLHADNSAKLCRGELNDCIVPCTPRGCFELIKKTGIEVKGKRALVIGRSKIVGMPMSNLLTWNHATVTLAHSRTVNMEQLVGEADILVVATGQTEMVKGAWVKQGAVVIDCGINSVPDATKKSGKRLVGDVEYAAAKERASWITPVPGGVGPMTVATLLQQTLLAAKRRRLSS